MDAITISAKFAAYTWYSECVAAQGDARDEAARFAEENWRHFLGHANEGLGRLLIQIARPRKPKAARRRRFAAAG